MPDEIPNPQNESVEEAAFKDSTPRKRKTKEEKAEIARGSRYSEANVRIREVQAGKLHVEKLRVWVDLVLSVLSAVAVFGIVFWWLSSVLRIVVNQADLEKRLPENVTISLLVTTTINIIGLLIIVLVYLFPRPASLQARLENRKRKIEQSKSRGSR